MAEQNTQAPKPVETIKQEFRAHLDSVEFGSPDYLAFCDFFALHEQESLRRIDLNNVERSLNPRDRLFQESALRITETRIAMIKNDIDHRKATDISYSKAYNQVDDTMSELYRAISEESKDEGDLKQKFVQETFHDMLVNEFRDRLYKFYD